MATAPSTPVLVTAVAGAALAVWLARRRRAAAPEPCCGSDDAERMRAAVAAAYEATVNGEASSEPLSAGSPLLRGLVTSTWMGARHAICDAGVPPDGPSDFPWPPQRELAIVRYAPNLLQGAPHALTLWVRAVAAADDADAEGNGDGSGGGGGGGGGGDGGGGRDDEWIELRNVSPEWNEAMGSFTLPFYSRAKLASKKNFHVVDPANPDDILLLLGKLKKEDDVTTFALDFCRPISALVAFGVALSAFEAEA